MVNFDKFLTSFIEILDEFHPTTVEPLPFFIKRALKDQGLEYKDGEIVKSQREISAKTKENSYGELEDEIMKLANEYYDKVLIKECNMERKEARLYRTSYIHGAKAMLEKAKWRPSEEQMIALDEASGIVGMFTQRGFYLTTLYNDLKKLNQQKSK